MTTFVKREIPVPTPKPIIEEVVVPVGAYLKCYDPVKKPESRKVEDVLVAWQKDRNSLRLCIERNNQKIDIIDELTHEPA